MEKSELELLKFLGKKNAGSIQKFQNRRIFSTFLFKLQKPFMLSNRLFKAN